MSQCLFNGVFGIMHPFLSVAKIEAKFETRQLLNHTPKLKVIIQVLARCCIPIISLLLCLMINLLVNSDDVYYFCNDPKALQ